MRQISGPFLFYPPILPMTFLSAMTEPEFTAYLEVAIPEFAQEKVVSGQWAQAEALALSRQGYAELLPHGLATPDHFLFTVRDRATSAAVGMLWFAVQQRGDQRIAYVYDIAIDPAHQRRGHARRAFAALEEQASQRGLSGIALHVFGHNTGAQALYRGLGYQTTNINMFKPLGAGPSA